jgi:hypothetical protein
MLNNDLFVSVSNPQSAEGHRREAARIRALAASVTTSVMKRHLEDRARAHAWLAGPQGDPADAPTGEAKKNAPTPASG